MAVTGFGYTGEGKLTAADLTAFLASMLNSGVMRDYLNELAVSESSPQAMSVDVDTGAFIVGKANFFNFVRNDVSLTLPISAADPTNARWDLVVVTRDAASGASTIEVVQGTPAGSPADPALSDTETEKQIAIARVVVGAAATSITDSDITDLRTYSAARAYDQVNFIDKPSDESVTSSTTLQDDNDFAFAVEANARYAVWGLFLFNAGTTPDFKFQWSLPSGATIDGLVTELGATHVWNAFSEAASKTLPGSGADLPELFMATLITGGTPGTAQLRWAQNTSDGGATTMKSGSYVAWQKVSA